MEIEKRVCNDCTILREKDVFGPHVTVYIESKEHTEIFGNKPRRDINWSCCGAVSLDKAKKFLKLLQKGIDILENFKED